jgi:nitroimidazol reductase NimA-like FMN-containing flavoprotein (pyridoxamine 5'-phosphate oxidase superfamily)
MEAKVVEILEANRIMAIGTVRPDGWPQTTIVGYAHKGTLLYFAISRSGQKFANIENDNRVSIAIGRDFHDPKSIKGLSMAAHASEVTDPDQRKEALRMLLRQHPGLGKLDDFSLDRSAVMRAAPALITIIDYSKGFGHSDVLTVGPGGMTAMTAERDDDWGFGESLKPLS